MQVLKDFAPMNETDSIVSWLRIDRVHATVKSIKKRTCADQQFIQTSSDLPCTFNLESGSHSCYSPKRGNYKLIKWPFYQVTVVDPEREVNASALSKYCQTVRHCLAWEQRKLVGLSSYNGMHCAVVTLRCVQSNYGTQRYQLSLDAAWLKHDLTQDI